MKVLGNLVHQKTISGDLKFGRSTHLRNTFDFTLSQ